MNLNLLLLIPLCTVLVLLFSGSKEMVRWISLAGSLIQTIVAVVLLVLFRQSAISNPGSSLHFMNSYTWFPSWNINYSIGVDGISVMMVLLTAVVVLAGVLLSWNVGKWTKEFYILLMLLATGAYGFFIAVDLFTMFFFFEMAVIPKFLLIAIWGSGRKEHSAMKLALMLMAGSSLVLAGILGTYYHSSPGHTVGTWNLVELGQLSFSSEVQHFLFPLMFVGFGVLSALFPFHTWAPEGHSSAPTAASMFLAGISMKLGGFGCLRIATYLFPEAAVFYSPWIVLLAIAGIVYGAIVTLKQKDIKMMNAYSSVSHCGFVLLGIGMLNYTAATGAVLQMISHGIMTALFFGVIGMIYERTHTRMANEMGGLLKVMPFIGTSFILAGLTSLGLPGLSGFVAEATVFIGSWQVDHVAYKSATILACASIVITAVYILRAAGFTLMGPVKKTEHHQLTDATWNERLGALVLIIPIIIIGTTPFWINDIISDSTVHWVRQTLVNH